MFHLHVPDILCRMQFTAPAERLQALTNYHTKEGDLTLKEGWDEAILYVYL